MTAAYAEPGLVLAFMMIPALLHGCGPRGREAVTNGPNPPPGGTWTWPVSDVTATVRVPFPASG